MFLVALYLSKYQLVERIRHATLGRYDTFSSRILNWKASFEYFFFDLKSFLIGHGLNYESNVIFSSDGQSLAPHNMFLMAMTAGGIFLLFSLSAFMVYAILQTSKSRVFLNLDFLPVLASGLSFAMTSPLFYTRYIWLPIIISLHAAHMYRKST